jgi:heme exporter protein A
MAPVETSPQAPQAPWVLQTAGLAGQRGERALFDGLNLQLAPGSVTWLRGRNGRGKTSLLRLLAGLSTPMAGSLHIAGRTLREGGSGWRRHWVYIGHQNALKDDLSASEALAFLARLHGAPHGPAEVEAALRRLGIFNRRHAPVRTLSQGQRRRVALARLVLQRASPLWLLDEPFDALDTEGIAALNSLIAEHAAAGGCVLLTSHQPLTLTEPPPTVLDLEDHAPARHPQAAAAA